MKFLLFIALTLGSQQVSAEIFSASHFGFGIENNRTYQMTAVGGSMFVLDWGKTLGSKFSFGLKTMGQGAENQHAQLLRLSSGPAVHYRFKAIEVHYSFGFFRESANIKHAARKVVSSGISQMISLQRYFDFGDKTSIGWGSYFNYSEGSLNSEGESIVLQNVTLSNGRRLHSTNQGFYASLRVSL